MAAVVGKSLKFIRVLNGRLSFSTTKSYINSRRLVKLYEHSKIEKTYYATAAHKYMSNDESSVKNDFGVSRNDQNITNIDEALSKIDSLVRRTGRIQVELIKNAFPLITTKEMTSSTHGLYLLRCCKYCYAEHPSKRIELVNDIWNRYQELGIQFDVRHYNTLLDVHISNGLDFNPVEILNSMEDNNIEPNKATYALVMKKYCQNGDINGASEILEHMKEKGLPVNEDVFNNLILGHVKNNDFAGAKEIIEVMRSSNLHPNADTYTVLACGYAASGNQDEMMKCLDQIEPETNVLSYLKVVDALASSGNHQLIDDVLSMIPYPENYQHEFVNSAVELIHKGFVDTAYKLIIASYTPQYEQGTHIFIKQLIKTGRPASEIIDFCSKIYKGNFSSMIFLTASKTAAECRRHDCIVPIFKKVLEQGQFIRPSNFWPAFKSLKDEASSDGIWMVLRQMCELGVPADFTTYYDVILPVLGTPHPITVIQNVEKSGQAKDVAADALFIYYCDLGKVDYAHHLTEIIHVHINEKLNVERFVNLFGDLNRDCVEKYLKLLKYMFMDENYFIEYDDVRGKLLAEMISKKPRLLEILVEKFDDLSFNPQTLRSCDHILRQMKNFKRGHLMVVDRLYNLSQNREMLNKGDLSVEEEERQINYLQADNASCRQFLIRRLNYHIKTKNLTRVSELLEKYDKLNFTYSPLLLSNLMSLYCMASDVEKATKTFNAVKANFPSFRVDLAKILEYATLLVKYEKLEESIEVMKCIKEPYYYGHRDNVVNKVRVLNLAVSNTDNPEFAKTMQDLMLPLCEEFRSKKSFLDSVLHLHLQRNDLAAAYEEFKNCINTHHIPAGLNSFLKKCISLNAKDMLQKVIDLSISHAGESYTLLELALAFVESRAYDRASAVIESLKQGASPKDVEDLCMRLRSQNKLRELVSFIHITRPLNHENRESLYCLAIKAYVGRNEFDKAVELYEELQKEIGEPSLKTVTFMKELLARNNQPVPMSVMSRTPSETNPEYVDATKTFVKYLEAGNAEAALTELSGMKKGYIRTLSVKTLSDLVDLCLQQKYLSDMSHNVHLMSYILDNVKDVLKPVLEKYSAAGDVDKFIAISYSFPDFSLMKLNFNSYFCKAFISSGKQGELLSHLEQRYDKKNKLFSFAAFEELLKYPEYEDRVFDLAVKYYNLQFTLPIAIVWAHYFSKENYAKADEIFQKFSIVLERGDNLILKSIRQNENVNLAKKYVDVVKYLNVRSRSKERAFGAALDVYVLKGMYDEAVALVRESEEANLQLHKYYLSTLVTLKNILEKENKPVPFYLPSEVSSESSSDSDTEK